MKELKETNWKEKYEKEHKLRQEAETETILVKGIGINSPEMKAAKQKIEELQKEIDRIKKENNECYNRIADLTESLKSKDYFKDPDYQYLVNENRRLESERNELLMDNKRLAAQIEDKIDQLRKSGM
jgi:two-component SAPR family response regulator